MPKNADYFRSNFQKSPSAEALPPDLLASGGLVSGFVLRPSF